MLDVRHATITDLPDITAIYNSTIPGRMVTADTELVTVESRLPWFHAHTPDKRPLWVFFKDNKMAGWASLQSFYGRPAYNATVEISIYVHEDFRHQGIGCQIMEYVFSQCPVLNVKTLLGFIFGHNIPSINLFKKYGFEEWGNYPAIAELDGIERDLLILGKRLR